MGFRSIPPGAHAITGLVCRSSPAQQFPAAVSAGSGTELGADDFTRANGGLGSDWTTVWDNFQIVSNGASCSGSNVDFALYTAVDWTEGPNQYSRCCWVGGDEGGQMGVVVRGQDGAVSGYSFYKAAGSGYRAYVVRWDSMSGTDLGDPEFVVTSGDYIQLEARGSTITARNVTTGASKDYTDATYSAGGAGIVKYDPGGRITDWSGGVL